MVSICRFNLCKIRDIVCLKYFLGGHNVSCQLLLSAVDSFVLCRGVLSVLISFLISFMSNFP